jgi:transcriptional adapter 2-alpha
MEGVCFPLLCTLRSNYIFHGKITLNIDLVCFVYPFTVESQLKEKIERLQEYRRNGIRTFTQAQQYERDKAQKYNTKPSIPALPPPPPIPLYIPLYPSASDTPIKTEPSSGSLISEGLFQESNESLSTLGSNSLGSESHLKPIGRKPANPLNITDCEGIHLLNDREQSLCSTLRLLPKSYLAIKDTMLGEYVKAGSLRRQKARDLIKIDVNKTSKIYNFFLEMGWIHSHPRFQHTYPSHTS